MLREAKSINGKGKMPARTDAAKSNNPLVQRETIKKKECC
jgi:hypothetical protein